MARKNKLAELLHIKRYTHGTSNEISFSVLDARRARADEERARRAKRMEFGGVISPSRLRQSEKGQAAHSGQHGVLWQGGAARKANGRVSRETATPATATPLNREQEIARRKRRRRTQRIVSGVVGTLLLLGVVGGVGMYVVKEIQAQDSARSSLIEAIELIAETDDEVLTLDETINGAVNQETVTAMEALQAEIPSLERKLTEADEQAQTLQSRLTGSQDREAAGQAANAAAARRTMFAQGSLIIDQAVMTFEVASQLQEAWDCVSQADALARTAAELVSETNEANVRQANDQTQQAIDLLDEASLTFQGAGTMQSSVGIQPYLDYIEKRREALEFALLSNEAILVQDRATAESYNAQYNEADAAAATLAEGLPNNPTDGLFESYDDTTDSLFESYHQARATAGSADSFLRVYLGEVGK